MANRTSLPDQLAALEQAGLIRRDSGGSRLEYVFRHVLSQDAAYQSLLKPDRRRLHGLVGACLERLSGDHAAEIAPALAQHFLAAGEDARALPYLELAAGDAARRHANSEAIAFLDRAIEAAARSGQPLARSADLTLTRGRLLELTSRYPAALLSYSDIEQRARAAGDEPTRLAALMALATVHAAPTGHYDNGRASAELEQALAIARLLGDRAAECKALWLQMLRCKWNSEDRLALEYGEQSIDISRALGLTESLAYALNDSALVHARFGHHRGAVAAAREAEQLWRSLGNLQLRVDALINTGDALRQIPGELAGADAPVEEAIHINEQIENRWGLSHGMLILGFVRGDQGRYGQAIRCLDESIRLGQQAGFLVPQVVGRAVLASLYVELGLPGRGMAIALEGRRVAELAMPTHIGLPLAAIAVCQVQLGLGDESQRAIENALCAHSDQTDNLFMLPHQGSLRQRLMAGDFPGALGEAIEVRDVLTSSGHHLNIPRAIAFAGEALLGLRRLDEAAAMLGESIQLAGASGARRGLWRTHALLASCEALRGRPDAANAANAAARAEIDYCIAQLDTDDLRQAFLGQADVQGVLRS